MPGTRLYTQAIPAESRAVEAPMSRPGKLQKREDCGRSGNDCRHRSTTPSATISGADDLRQAVQGPRTNTPPFRRAYLASGRGPTKTGNNTGNEGPGTAGNRRSATRRRKAATRPAEQKELQRCRATKLRFATFNLGQSGAGGIDQIISNGHRLNEIMTALEKIKFHVIGLAETHTKKAQKLRWKEGELKGSEVHVGVCEMGRNRSTIGGVGFIIHKSLTHCIHSIDLQSSRVGVLKLNVPGQRAPLKIVQVYAPHSGYCADDHEQFYQELEEKLIDPACRTIVMGDFNARTGGQLADETYIGPFTAETRNEPGHRMSSFAEAQQLYVANGFFPKPIRKRWTWQSADGVTRSEVDYILCDDRRTVTNVEVLSRFEARSDHRIVRATMMLDLPQLKRDRILNGKRKIPSMVSDELLRANVEAAEWPSYADKRINARYESLEETLLKCVRAAKVKKPSASGSRITEETKTLMKRLQMLKQSGEDPEECRTLSREVRSRLVADYEDYRNTRLIEAAVARESLKRCKRKLTQSQLVTGALRDANGQLQTERRKIEGICRDFYASLFESKVHVPKTGAVADEAEELLPDVTAAEVEVALKKFKNGKAPGPDGITAEMLKAAGITLWQKVAKFFTICLRAKQIPLKWKESRTVLLFKKGDPEDLKNYRPICLLPVLYKLFTKVVLNRITSQLDAAQPNEQAGFRSGYCTLDHMQVMNQLQEKAREKNMKLYLVFIDYEKAFDSIEINAVLNAIQKQGVQQQYVDVLYDVYDGCTTEVTLYEEPIAIPIGRGVRQGDTISPKLFTAALEEVFKPLDWNGRRACGITLDGQRLTHLRFADDIVLIGSSKKDVQQRLEELNRASEAVGLRINRSKTKWMSYSKTGERIELDGEEIERVDKYVYLGQELSEDHQQGLRGEISRRIKAAWCSFNSIGDVLRKLTDPVRRSQLFNSTILPALLYGCETWTLTETLAKRLRSTQRAMERRVLGVTMWGCRLHEGIRRETQFLDAVKEAEKRKLSWAGHVARRDDNRWTTHATRWKPQKKAPPNWGRPTRWEELMTRRIGQNWWEEAQDRAQYRVQCTAQPSPHRFTVRRRSRRID